MKLVNVFLSKSILLVDKDPAAAESNKETRVLCSVRGRSLLHNDSLTFIGNFL